MRLEVSIPYWSDFVGTFDPRKVIDQVVRAFPDTVVDPTDHQAARHQRERDHFAASVDEPLRSTLIGQSRRAAEDNGPTFRFEIPTEAGSIRGQARRYNVSFDLPDRVDPGMRDRLEAFLSGLRLGEPRPVGESGGQEG